MCPGLLRNAVGASGRCHRGGEEEGEEAGQEELRRQPRPLGRARGGGGAVVAGEGRRRREEIQREAIWQGGAKQQGSNLGSVGVDGIMLPLSYLGSHRFDPFDNFRIGANSQMERPAPFAGLDVDRLVYL